jgi:hypothetical protein
MKTRLYTIFTGLLMAACITSYGQEIIGTFTSTSNSHGGNITEAPDGSIIISNYVGNGDYMVYKLSPEGILIDSISLPGTEPYYFSQLLEIPSEPDLYMIAFVRIYTNILIKFILIDDNLVVVNETNKIIEMEGSQPSFSVSSNCYFVTPNNNIIFTYSHLDPLEGVYIPHFARFTIDGTFLEDMALTDIPYDSGFNAPTCDSVLHYTHTGFKVFCESPLTYSCFGSYTNNDTIYFANCIIDSAYHFIERIEYAPTAPDMAFTNEYMADIIPFKQPDAISHLMTTNLTLANRSAPAIIKYNGVGNPISSHLFSDAPNAYTGKTIVKDENTIYFSYDCNRFGISNYLIRMDGNLEVTWKLPIPCPTTQQNGICSIKVLQNGDIAVGTTRYITQNSSILEVFIIRDGYDSTHKNTTIESPFTPYPNPVKDRLTLRFDDGVEPESVELFNLAGCLVATRRNNIQSIDMSTMSSGVYMLRVTMKDGARYHEKILKE